MLQSKLWDKCRELISMGADLPHERIISGMSKRPANLSMKTGFCEIGSSKITPYGKPTHVSTERKEGQLIRTIRQAKIARYMLTFRGNGAADYAANLQGCYGLESIQAYLYQSGFSIRRVEIVSRLPEVVDKQYQQKAIVGLELWFETDRTETVNYADKVDVTVFNENGQIFPPITKEPRA